MALKVLNIWAIRFGKILASLALLVTTMNANTTCIFITHQPELPEDAKKLRRF